MSYKIKNFKPETGPKDRTSKVSGTLKDLLSSQKQYDYSSEYHPEQ